MFGQGSASGSTDLTEKEAALLQHELDQAQSTIRSLQRQISTAQAHYQEIARAYNLTVSNLMEITRQNTMLERECELLRARATGREPVTIGDGGLRLAPEEISAIRKAMARLHHPDAGGDSERMKVWNMVLDSMER